MVGMVAGCSHACDDDYAKTILTFETDALAAKILLTELRAGRATNAMELLEQQIDSSVIVIDGALSDLEADDREKALDTLRALKDYREQHPRRKEAAIEGMETYGAFTADMTARASNILSELER